MDASSVPVVGEPRPADPRAGEASAPVTPEELASAAAELAALVEHHRQELVDAMAELTRLQRVLRAETRAAIDAITAALGQSAAGGPGDPVEG